VEFIDANGVRFAYIERGSGPLVLLFHGYPETARSWSGVQERLAAAGYRVVAPFMRGYPPSEPAKDDDYRVRALGADVLALIDAFHAENAIVVGHDWGASAVYAAAGEHPEKIKALVAISIPHPRGTDGDPAVVLSVPHFLYYQLPWARWLVRRHDFGHIDHIYAKWAPTYHPTAQALNDIKSTLRLPGAVDGALGYYWSFFRARSGGASAKAPIAVPSLIITGSVDGGIRPPAFGKPGSSYYEKARSAFTGRYAFVELDGIGHFPQLEAPDAVADAILAFIAPPASG